MKRKQTRKRQRKNKIRVVFVLAVIVLFSLTYVFVRFWKEQPKVPQEVAKSSEQKGHQVVETAMVSRVQKAKIMASGDMLYHIGVYESARQDDGTYDFTNNYAQIKPLITRADLAIGDFEGTINEDYPLAGYPLFNAPKEVVEAIKGAGYDAIDLAHNHILDSELSGLKTTYDAFKQAGLSPFGVNRDANDTLLVKEINGIKVAILGFAYGFNGLEARLTDEEYETHLKDLTPEKVKKDIQKAEEIADITVVLPQMGVEYMLEPNAEQKTLYRQMIEWGADIIFGGHPHVMQPTEIIEKDGTSKFIIYSMGNLISNQRVETMDDTPNSQWTERGVIVEVDVEKKGTQTTLTSITLHPTWVSKKAIVGKTRLNGAQAYDYQVFLGKDYIDGGQYVDTVDSATLSRIRTAYYETLEFLNLQFKR